MYPLPCTYVHGSYTASGTLLYSQTQFGIGRDVKGREKINNHVERRAGHILEE